VHINRVARTPAVSENDLKANGWVKLLLLPTTNANPNPNPYSKFCNGGPVSLENMSV